MKRIHPSGLVLPNLPRRRFIQGLVAGGIVLGLAPWFKTAAARGSDATATAPVLSGTEFDLTVAESPVNFTGAPRLATTINGSIPAPTLRWRAGDTVTIRVTNRLAEDTSIHWHGILLPYQMDGVPGISFKGIPPGETFTYRFKVAQTGTYWYHSHSGMQEQTGMYGAIVIDPARGESIRADRDYVVQLSIGPTKTRCGLSPSSRCRATTTTSTSPPWSISSATRTPWSVGAALDKRRMWNQMRMSPTDLADVSGYTYTYLMNGAAPAATGPACSSRASGCGCVSSAPAP